MYSDLGAVAESLTRGYPHRSIQLALGDIGTDGPKRSELDDAEFEEAKFGTALSSSLSSLSSRVDNKSGGARGGHFKRTHSHVESVLSGVEGDTARGGLCRAQSGRSRCVDAAVDQGDPPWERGVRGCMTMGIELACLSRSLEQHLNAS